MDDKGLLREIDEDVRRERYLQLWRKYRLHAIGAVTAIVAAPLAYVGYDAWIDAALQRDADALAAVEDDEDRQGREARLAELGRSGRGGYRALAYLHLAALRLDSNENPQAAAAYRDAAEAMSADSALRGWATIRSSYADFADVDGAELKRRLADFLEEGAPWRPFALEALAFAELRDGRRAAARAHYEELATAPATPAGMRRRALDALAFLGAD